jgi:hypothetical protein
VAIAKALMCNEVGVGVGTRWWEDRPGHTPTVCARAATAQKSGYLTLVSARSGFLVQVVMGD